MVRYGTLPFIGVIDRLQADVLFIFKKSCKASQLLLCVHSEKDSDH